ncbi:DUF3597 domain-containing protein [Qipengyuania sediminis]|uniref:DUF3597 domain-containing protein n=1 Tax=Qipengyuania sediminis TaxID=1532023 RepID=UPI00105A5D9F|nr:DUF3597 domain-containing protein [Qipengyuania sediminis]
MGIFSSIKDAIFGKKAHAQGLPQSAGVPPPAPTGNAFADAPVVAPAQPQQTTLVNVENSLDSMPGADGLNWRTSIVDLMKLIGVDSDYASRKALAEELGRQDYSGDADDNLWLHKRVMQELAANGGEVPESLK